MIHQWSDYDLSLLDAGFSPEATQAVRDARAAAEEATELAEDVNEQATLLGLCAKASMGINQIRSIMSKQHGYSALNVDQLLGRLMRYGVAHRVAGDEEDLTAYSEADQRRYRGHLTPRQITETVADLLTNAWVASDTYQELVDAALEYQQGNDISPLDIEAYIDEFVGEPAPETEPEPIQPVPARERAVDYRMWAIVG